MMARANARAYSGGGVMSAVDKVALDEELESEEPFSWKMQSVAAGVALCVGIGLLFSNILLGVALGLLTGILVGYALDYGIPAEGIDDAVKIPEEKPVAIPKSKRPAHLAHRLSA
jgi:uncharacterized membrane protein